MINSRVIITIIFFFAATAFADGSEKPGKENPLYLRADTITYDQDKELTRAKGNVEVYHSDGYVLLADEVTYVPKTNQIEASGNVLIYNENKDIIFAENFKGAPDFKEAEILSPAALTADNRRMVAKVGYKNGDIARFEKGTYTPCNSCRETSETPLWQIKAREIIHEEEAQDVIYKDAWLELWGAPIFYLPYMRQPDPTVKRRSGLLNIKVGSRKREGLTVIPSYYYTFAPNSDFLFNPIIYSKEMPIFRGTYRHRFLRAKMNLSGSITRADLTTGTTTSPIKKGKSVRWHTKSNAELDLSDLWRLSMQLHKASDETYITKFKIEENQAFLPDNLESNIVAEGFYGKNYATIQGFAFQTTKESTEQKQIPFVLPQAKYSFVTNADEGGAYFYGDTGLLSLVREKGADVRRLSTLGGWEKPFYTNFGDVITFTAQARFDAYNYTDFTLFGKTKAEDGYTGRFFPQAMVEWRRPLMIEDFMFPTSITPVVNFIGAPVMGINRKIPNEDSQAGIELSEASIFSFSRFTGLDKIDSGSRLNYGFSFDVYPKNGRALKLFIGQSYSLAKNKDILQGEGIGKGASDIVGALDILSSQYLHMKYAYLFDHKNFSARRSQVSFSAGVPIFRVSGNYIYFDKNANNTAFNGREQIDAVINSQLSKFWGAEIKITRDLGKKGKTLSRGAGVVFENECLRSVLSLNQTYFHNRDIKPDTGIFLTVIFKTLGGINSGHTISERSNK